MSDATAPYQPFQLQNLGETLRPQAFGVLCNCGQTVFSVAGLGPLTITLPDGMNVKAVCKCGREHSLQDQRGAQPTPPADLVTVVDAIPAELAEKVLDTPDVAEPGV